MKINRLDGKLLVGLVGLVCVLLAPILLHFFFVPVEYNQFSLQRTEWSYFSISHEMAFDSLSSAHASGVQFLLQRPNGTLPAYEDENAFFDYIVSWIPPYAIVYPTEGFYYFNVWQPDGNKISGNVRIADLDKGTVSFAYFYADPESYDDKNVHIATFGEKDGLGIQKESDYSYFVTYKGKTIHFKIPQTDFTPPKKTRMLPEEEFVGQIHDESGIRLFLLYNHRTHSFYEVLNEEIGVPDTLEPLSTHLFLGTRTDFFYYQDLEYNRKLFLGNSFYNNEMNNFFDGPGDQVPFRADLLEKLHISYPSTMLGDGVDAHGVLLGRDEWARFVIAPFLMVNSPTPLYERIGSCQPEQDKSIYWTCLTKEWWYTPAWRKLIFEKLAGEGKSGVDPLLPLGPVDSNVDSNANNSVDSNENNNIDSNANSNVDSNSAGNLPSGE